uniref:Aminopeptidase O (putative) n=1 Tax=Piliocolobus tephrosceles TaxID=591936 RepID=A0A8C9HSW4_9PRIM
GAGRGGAGRGLGRRGGARCGQPRYSRARGLACRLTARGPSAAQPAGRDQRDQRDQSSAAPRPLQLRLRAAGARGDRGLLLARPPRLPSAPSPCCRRQLLPDQLVLLLEHLLEQKTLSPRTLQSLQRTYHLQDQDAEVRHRWCELIVKHKFTKAYKSVERFLQEDQAMGVYLYGELMVSEDARQQQLARRCFERTREQMDRSSAQVVADMLF